MDARARILAIRLMELIEKDPVYAQSLGIKADLQSTSMSNERRMRG